MTDYKSADDEDYDDSQNDCHRSTSGHLWVSTYPPEVLPHGVPRLTVGPGPKNTGGANSPIDFTRLFLTPELMRTWVEQTELYTEASIRLQRPLQQHSRAHDWNWGGKGVEEKVRELEAFIGLTVLMGIVEKPSITDYWNIQNPSINTPFFRETVTSALPAPSPLLSHCR